MKKLIIFISLLALTACGRQDQAAPAPVTASATKFVMSDSELCNELADWKQGVSNQIVAPTQNLAFYDTGVFKIDFIKGGEGQLVTDATYQLDACKIIIENGAVSVTFPAPAVTCGYGWFQQPCQNNFNFGGMQ